MKKKSFGGGGGGNVTTWTRAKNTNDAAAATNAATGSSRAKKAHADNDEARGCRGDTGVNTSANASVNNTGGDPQVGGSTRSTPMKKRPRAGSGAAAAPAPAPAPADSGDSSQQHVRQQSGNGNNLSNNNNNKSNQNGSPSQQLLQRKHHLMLKKHHHGRQASGGDGSRDGGSGVDGYRSDDGLPVRGGGTLRLNKRKGGSRAGSRGSRSSSSGSSSDDGEDAVEAEAGRLLPLLLQRSNTGGRERQRQREWWGLGKRRSNSGDSNKKIRNQKKIEDSGSRGTGSGSGGNGKATSGNKRLLFVLTSAMLACTSILVASSGVTTFMGGEGGFGQRTRLPRHVRYVSIGLVYPFNPPSASASAAANATASNGSADDSVSSGSGLLSSSTFSARPNRRRMRTLMVDDDTKAGCSSSSGGEEEGGEDFTNSNSGGKTRDGVDLTLPPDFINFKTDSWSGGPSEEVVYYNNDGAIRTTLVTQTSLDRVWILGETCKRWKDPIIAVAPLRSSEGGIVERDETPDDLWNSTAGFRSYCPQLQLVPFLLDSEQSLPQNYPVNVLRNVGLDLVNTTHVLVADVDFVPSLNLNEKIRTAIVSRRRQHRREVKLKKEKGGENTEDEYDGDDDTDDKEPHRDAIVVPAFERLLDKPCASEEECKRHHAIHKQGGGSFIPRTFGELRRCVGNSGCVVFHAITFKNGHGSTRSEEWLERKWYEEEIDLPPAGDEPGDFSDDDDDSVEGVNADALKPIRRVKCLHESYEPYVVLRWKKPPASSSPKTPCSNGNTNKGQLVPYYDEMFRGYGMNKIQHIRHLHWLKYKFFVLPEGFLVHSPHVISKSNDLFRGIGDNENERHYDYVAAVFGLSPTKAASSSGGASAKPTLRAEMSDLYSEFLRELEVRYAKNDLLRVPFCDWKGRPKHPSTAKMTLLQLQKLKNAAFGSGGGGAKAVNGTLVKKRVVRVVRRRKDGVVLKRTVVN